MNSNRSSRSTSLRSALAAGLGAVALLLASDAAPFAGLVSPPRFELKAKPGDVVREVLEIGNDTSVADEFAVSTADWSLNEKGGVDFAEPLEPGSCRPWVRIERHTVRMQPHAVRKYRFEVHVPPDAKPAECRFAIIIEKASETMPDINTGTIQFPLQGRIGVIVYLSIGDVAPKLELRGLGVKDFNGHPTPAATFYNAGNAHGRPEGLLDGKDATGKSFEFIVSPFPILPGETRPVALWAQEGPDKKMPEIRYPLQIHGRIEWDGGRKDIDATITDAPPVKAGS